MIEIKRWDTGEVIYSGEFKSVKECLEQGVKERVNFYRAELNYAELNNAKLNNAELNYAKLNNAKLNDAELNNAKLNDAKLNDAKLNNAKLNDAELNYAELNNAQLNNAKLNNAQLNNAIGTNNRVTCLQLYPYKLVACDNILHGGCTTKTFQEWLDYDGLELANFDKRYLETITKPFIRMLMAKGE